MKVFDRPFFQKGRRSRAEPLVASAEAKLFSRRFNSRSELLVHFFGLLFQRKNGEGFLNVTYLNFLPAFFFDTAGAKQKAWQRRNAEKISRLRARRGRCPRPATFLKKGRSKTFILLCVSVWWRVRKT